MLTRLRVRGFKSLVDVDVRFGPFTCVAGPNGVGKSNLFDAITLLQRLMDRPLLEAALEVRGEGGSAGDPRAIFHHVGGEYDREMSFEAEMLVPASGTDDLGQIAQARSTFLRYSLTIGLHQPSPRESGEVRINDETLEYITASDAHQHLLFDHSVAWRNSVVRNERRAGPYISREVDEKTQATYIRLHQDGTAGVPRRYIAHSLPRTALSTVNALESPTALLARREIQSWRLLQLEPSALRRSDSYRDPAHVGADGAHVAATLLRLAGLRPGSGGEVADTAGAEAVYARIANRLAQLIEGVQRIRVDDDPRRELLTVVMSDSHGSDHPARSLSDGTLRFLALAVLEADPEFVGTLCFEEPENGIHPDRVEAMLLLLQALGTDVEEPAGAENPLRQVIVNTHSPSVVGLIPDASLLSATMVPNVCDGHTVMGTSFEWLPDTWRAKAEPSIPPMPRGRLLNYLRPFSGMGKAEDPRLRRVIDREDISQLLLFSPASSR